MRFSQAETGSNLMQSIQVATFGRLTRFPGHLAAMRPKAPRVAADSCWARNSECRGRTARRASALDDFLSGAGADSVMNDIDEVWPEHRYFSRTPILGELGDATVPVGAHAAFAGPPGQVDLKCRIGGKFSGWSLEPQIVLAVN